MSTGRRSTTCLSGSDGGDKRRMRLIGRWAPAALTLLTLTSCSSQRVDYRGPEALDRVVAACAELAFGAGPEHVTGQVNDFRAGEITAAQTAADPDAGNFDYEISGEVVITTHQDEIFQWVCDVTVSERSELAATLTSFEPATAPGG